MEFLDAFLSQKFPDTERSYGNVLLAAQARNPRARNLLKKRDMVLSENCVAFLFKTDFLSAVSTLQFPCAPRKLPDVLCAAFDGEIWAEKLLAREGLALAGVGVSFLLQVNPDIGNAS